MVRRTTARLSYHARPHRALSTLCGSNCGDNSCAPASSNHFLAGMIAYILMQRLLLSFDGIHHVCIAAGAVCRCQDNGPACCTLLTARFTFAHTIRVGCRWPSASS